jgi:tRNA(fMet)-specific endonuclease VapC
MSGRYLLDTNIVIALFADEAAVTSRLEDADEVLVPAIVLGELYYGACKSGRVEENMARIDDLAARNVVLACDAHTARRYGEVKDGLRQKGRPIPESDIWIAAMALQHDLVLAARDAHFREVAGLNVEAW